MSYGTISWALTNTLLRANFICKLIISKVIVFVFLIGFSFLYGQVLNPQLEEWRWMDEQVYSDFANVAKFTWSDVEKTYKQLPKGLVQCYEIHQGDVCGPDGEMLEFLKEVAKRYPLPDIIFLYSPLHVIRADLLRYFHIKVPIFCSAKAPKTDGQIISFINCNGTSEESFLNWKKLAKEIEKIHSLISWEEKIPRLFWRDKIEDRYGQGIWHTDLAKFPRGILVTKGMASKKIIDAKFVSSLERQSLFSYIYKGSPSKHLLYKFLIAVDGESPISAGLQWRLFSQCVTLKQESEDTLWYYHAIKPWEHYVPLKRDLSDLEEMLVWLLQNEGEAKNMAKRAYDFAKNNLMPEHLFIYGYKALLMYSLFLVRDC